MSMSRSSSAHILIYPFPAPGHIIPLLDLTRKLLAGGLTITLLITQKNLHLLPPPSPTFHHLLLPTPQLPPFEKRPFAYERIWQETHSPLILDWFRSHHSPPVAIISDFLLCWVHHLASQIGVPRIVFSPSSTFAFAVSDSIWRAQPRKGDAQDVESLLSVSDVPNCPKYPWWQVSYLYLTPEEAGSNMDWEFFRECFLKNMESSGIVFNSFDELEHVYLDHVGAKFGRDRVWAVGPILPTEEDATPAVQSRGGSSVVPCHEVMTWLDSKDDGSVVYICFGSRGMLRRKQMDELAAALERSTVNFIWCVRQPDEKQVASGEYGVLPDGYEDRVAGRGLIVKGWAPQLAILRHRAVAVFLTHCGWNSVLEGVTAGVVMLTWPMDADQFPHAQLVVDELGVGISIGEGSRKIPEAAGLGRILDESLMENLPQRVKANMLQEAASSAINGGSSCKDLDGLIKTLNEF